MRLLGWALAFLVVMAAGFGLGLLAARESWPVFPDYDLAQEAGA